MPMLGAPEHPGSLLESVWLFRPLCLLLGCTVAAQASQARLKDYLSCSLDCRGPPAAPPSSTKEYAIHNGVPFISSQRQQRLQDAAAPEAASASNGRAAPGRHVGGASWTGRGGRQPDQASAEKMQQPLALSHRTLPVTARGLDGALHYDTHNLYGLAEAAATYEALAAITRKRPFLLTRWTWCGPGPASGDLMWTCPASGDAGMILEVPAVSWSDFQIVTHAPRSLGLQLRACTVSWVSEPAEIMAWLPQVACAKHCPPTCDMCNAVEHMAGRRLPGQADGQRTGRGTTPLTGLTCSGPCQHYYKPTCGACPWRARTYVGFPSSHQRSCVRAGPAQGRSTPSAGRTRLTAVPAMKCTCEHSQPRQRVARRLCRR